MIDTQLRESQAFLQAGKKYMFIVNLALHITLFLNQRGFTFTRQSSSTVALLQCS